MKILIMVLAVLSVLVSGFVIYLYIQGLKEKKRQKKYLEDDKKAKQEYWRKVHAEATARNNKKESFLKKYSGKKKYQKAPSK